MKKSRFYKTSTAAFLLSILLTACPSKTEYFNLNPEIKDYCMFAKESYWVYKDAMTNNTDSVILMQSLLEYINGFGEWGYNSMHEVYESNSRHFLSDSSSVFLTFRIIAKEEKFSRFTYPVIAFNSGIQNAEKNVILYLPLENSTNSYLYSYNIGETVFNNVKVVTGNNNIVINDSVVSDYYTKSYWAKNIGLIRYEIYNLENEMLNIYNLVKHNVKLYDK